MENGLQKVDPNPILKSEIISNKKETPFGVSFFYTKYEKSPFIFLKEFIYYYIEY